LNTEGFINENRDRCSGICTQLKAGKGIKGKDGALTPLIKQLTEMALQAEIETHLS